MLEEWAKEIQQRLLAFEQRKEEIRVATIEIISELREAIPSSMQLKWELNETDEIKLLITIGSKQECFAEAEIREAQQIYDLDEIGNPIVVRETKAKEAIIKLIMEQFKWIVGQ
jgi:hypothetical protein